MRFFPKEWFTACLKSMAASAMPIMVVVRCTSPMPRYSVPAIIPHRLFTTPPPREMTHECLLMPIPRISSQHCWSTAVVLYFSVPDTPASSISSAGTTTFRTSNPAAMKPVSTFSPNARSQISSVTRKLVASREVGGRRSLARSAKFDRRPGLMVMSVRSSFPGRKKLLVYSPVDTSTFPAMVSGCVLGSPTSSSSCSCSCC
mmetsp:Transcript_2473/g.5044  ORF Transcript_2473/g.5044 Transcript_2473/m.5044 type:complete len:202 (+) Transcript_2473:301-906(+)